MKQYYGEITMYFQSGLTSYQTLVSLVRLAQSELDEGNVLSDMLLRDLATRKEHAISMARKAYEAREITADTALRCIMDCESLTLTV